MANEFKVKKGLIIEGSSGTLLDIQGSVGQLFSVTDSLTGDLFAVSDISGVPILIVNSSGAVDVDGTLDITGVVSMTNYGAGILKTNSSGVVSIDTSTYLTSINNSNWSGTDLAVANGGTGSSSASGARTNLGLGSLATLNTVGSSEIVANSVGASELNVSGNGSSGQVLTSDGDGTMTWTAKTANTDTITSVGVSGSEISGIITLTSAGATSLTQSGGTIEIRSTDTIYTVGDGGLTQKNFTTALNTKLDGIATSADVTPSWVPASDPSYLTALPSHNHDDRYYTETEIDDDLETLTASLRANVNITGGGTITFDSSAYLKNSARFIIIANGRGTHFATSGYFDVNIPTSGTITGVGGSSNKTATSAGVPLDTWEALYYILPIGSTNGSVAANFRVARYTSNVVIPEHWVLIAVRNGDSGQKTWVINKYALEPGEDINTTVYDARYAADADTLDGNHASAFSTASGVEDNADVTDTANVVAALTAGTNVTIAADGTISSTDTDTVYVHPTSAGNKHIPTGGAAGQFLKYSSSGTAIWATPSYTTNTNTVTSVGVSGSETTGTVTIAASGAASVSQSGSTVTIDATNTTYTVGDGGLTQKNFTTTLKNKLDGIASGADAYTGWNFVDTNDTATRVDSLEYFKIAGATISGTGTSQDPYLVNTPDTDTNTFRPIDQTPTNGATGDSISSDWAYDNVRNFSNGGNSLAGTFTATGDVVAYSDVRVKENIKDIDNALDKVTQLRGVEYSKIGSNENSIGVIAQEIQKVLPEVVREDQDGMLGVSYGNITAILIEAIKEQQKQIDELKEIINGITK